MRILLRRASKLPFSAIPILFLLLLPNCQVFAQPTGSIKGTVLDASNGEPLADVNIVLKGTTLGGVSDNEGKFIIANIPPATYVLSALAVGYETAEVPNVSVRANDTTSESIRLKESNIQVGEVVVYGASFRRERITEAPAAVSTIESGEITLNSGQGQVPKLLEMVPGIDISQNGLFDFNVNTRGFNSSLNRRLLVLLDGRDLAIVFLGAQEWNGLSVPAEDLGRIEIVRGPGSALYGANAFNGVLNIISPTPRQSLGTKFTLAAGELHTVRGDLRQAGTSDKWSYKINIGRSQADTWSVPRDTSQPRPFEYEGFNPFLNLEVRRLNTNPVTSTYGSARVDYEVNNRAFAVAEAGLAQVENEVYITGIGRVQVTRALKPWGRVNYSDDHSSAQVWASGRDSREPQYSLSTGLPLHEQSLTLQSDYQYHISLLNEKIFVTTGLSYRYQTIDTRETLMLDDHKDNMSGLYAQIEYRFSDYIKAVAASRWDRSTLYASQFSPKAALVWTPDHNQSFRLTFNRAFQAPNYSELFLYVLHPSRALAYLGNDNLTVEKINGYEFGYKGIFRNTLFVTLDGYYNELSDFITDLTPGVNPAYHGQENIGGTLRTVWSYGNAGKVTEAGFELGLNYFLSDSWVLEANYSFFDFHILQQSANSELLPNTPKHKLNGGFSYRQGNQLEVGLTVKYVPSFDWAAGIYAGRILAYTIVNLAARYRLAPNVSLGLDVSNLLNREHYEIFGGSLLRRRAVGTLTITL
ncbi:MAG TPA: TonB-dependent receptor [Bacteroidota bacterium]|nr:TonB-dependent receptor [Bacteroidota bacterium]